MKRLLLTVVAVLGLAAMSMSPADAALNRVGTNQGPVDGVDCPIYSVAASVQKMNLTAQPLNLGFGAAIGHDKAPVQSCASEHRLDVKYYLFLLPPLGPRTLVSIGQTDAFCDACTCVQGFSSIVAAPGMYQVVADFYVDYELVTSAATPSFLYVPLLATLALTDVPEIPTLPTLPI